MTIQYVGFNFIPSPVISPLECRKLCPNIVLYQPRLKNSILLESVKELSYIEKSDIRGIVQFFALSTQKWNSLQ